MDSRQLWLLPLMMVAMMTFCFLTPGVKGSLPVEEEEGRVGMVGAPLSDGLFPSGGAPQMSSKRANQEDISKLLLKHLRFRQLPEPASDYTRQSRRPADQEKRQEQRMLVNNLAALLSGLRDRQVESSMRMPSLRFGK